MIEFLRQKTEAKRNDEAHTKYTKHDWKDFSQSLNKVEVYNFIGPKKNSIFFLNVSPIVEIGTYLSKSKPNMLLK